VTIPASGQAVSTLTVPQDVRIGNLAVRLNLSMPQDGQLRIYLVGPDGTKVELVNHRGGSGHDFRNTLLEDQAHTPLWSGRAPFDGTFRPDAPLSHFDGKNAHGTWKLVVIHDGRGAQGVVNGWSLIVSPPGPAHASASAASVDNLFASAEAMGQLQAGFLFSQVSGAYPSLAS
jgi:subtilisin-like proprotein convertase family protein